MASNSGISNRQTHRFRLDELNALADGDQTNQPKSGPVYFSTATHPEFGYLSNDYRNHFCIMDPVNGPSPDTSFRTAEQFINWMKAVVFGDDAQSDNISAVRDGDPVQCRKYGAQVAGFDQKEWDKVQLNHMESGLFAKFWYPFIVPPDGEDLLGKILNTGERELVYAVEDDRVWGVGYSPGDAGKNRGKWGQNLLGRALMGARETARQHKQLGLCRGDMLASNEERLYRAAVMMGKMKWDEDGNLEVVKEKCAKGEELKAITKMVKMARDGPETCLAKDIVRRMRKSRAHEEDCGCDAH